MAYAPNQERDVVLGCGCLDTWAFAIRVIGSGPGRWWQSCPNGHMGSGKWGLQPIKREATSNEVLRFYGQGIPATVRRARRTSKKLQEMSREPEGATSPERGTSLYDQAKTLF